MVNQQEIEEVYDFMDEIFRLSFGEHAESLITKPVFANPTGNLPASVSGEYTFTGKARPIRYEVSAAVRAA